MQKDENLKLLFVINPVSGGKKKTDWETQIRNYIKDSVHNMDFFLLSGKSDEASVRHHISMVKPDRVVAVGGDGTVKMVAEIIHDTDISLAIIPAGSANGMAKELTIPLDVNKALDIAINGRITPIDGININGKETCIHLSDLGLNAILVKYFEQSKSRGMWGYGQAVFKMITNKQKLTYKFETSDKTFTRKAYMVVLANARQYGTGATINPEGNVSDGVFEIVIVKKINFFGLLNMLITHKPFHKEKVEIISTDKLKITSSKRTFFQVDGEYRGRTKIVTATIRPKFLKVMLPHSDM